MDQNISDTLVAKQIRKGIQLSSDDQWKLNRYIELKIIKSLPNGTYQVQMNWRPNFSIEELAVYSEPVSKKSEALFLARQIATVEGVVIERRVYDVDSLSVSEKDDYDLFIKVHLIKSNPNSTYQVNLSWSADADPKQSKDWSEESLNIREALDIARQIAFRHFRRIIELSKTDSDSATLSNEEENEFFFYKQINLIKEGDAPLVVSLNIPNLQPNGPSNEMSTQIDCKKEALVAARRIIEKLKVQDATDFKMLFAILASLGKVIGKRDSFATKKIIEVIQDILAMLRNNNTLAESVLKRLLRNLTNGVQGDRAYGLRDKVRTLIYKKYRHKIIPDLENQESSPSPE